MTSQELIDRLQAMKDKWRTVKSGGCQMLSLGDHCTCNLCVLDEAIDAVKHRTVTEGESRG